MPYVIPVADGDFFEVRLVGLLHGQTCISTFRYEIEKDPSPTTFDMAVLGDNFEDLIWTGLRELMSVEFVSARIYTQKIWPTRYVAFEQTCAEPTGAVSGNCCPSTVSMVWKRKMGLAGRDRRGRLFMPAVPVSSEENSAVTAAVFNGSQVADVKVAMVSQIDCTSGIFATPSLIVPDGGGYVNRGDIEIVELDQILRVQRRRELQRGI